jgi:RNA polymerase sigma-70 factor (ECF subfamily)
MIVIALPDIPSEDRLLARARQGQQDAIMQIYERYFPPIFQFIRLRVGDRALAEDLASEVFVKLVGALQGSTAPRHSLRGWLFRVARNEIHDHYGKSRQLPTTTLDEWLPSSPDHDPEVQFMRLVSVERARRAIRLLAAEQQEVLILRFGQMLSLQETADIMGKSTSAIKSLQYRAINTLRSILDGMRTETANG